MASLHIGLYVVIVCDIAKIVGKCRSVAVHFSPFQYTEIVFRIKILILRHGCNDAYKGDRKCRRVQDENAA